MWEGPGQTPEVGEAMHHGESALGFTGHWDFPKWGCHSIPVSPHCLSPEGERLASGQRLMASVMERENQPTQDENRHVGRRLLGEEQRDEIPSEMEEVDVRNNQSCCEGEGEGLGISSKSEKEN